MAEVKKVKVKGPNGKTISVPENIAKGLLDSPTKEYTSPGGGSSSDKK